MVYSIEETSQEDCIPVDSPGFSVVFSIVDHDILLGCVSEMGFGSIVLHQLWRGEL